MSGDCEIAQFYSTAEHVARQHHPCCECSAAIVPGERYFQCTAMWEGVISRYRQHFLCQKACELVRDAGFNDDECLMYGGLQEWYEQAKHDGEVDKGDPDWKRLRDMLAKILRRERNADPATGISPEKN